MADSFSFKSIGVLLCLCVQALVPVVHGDMPDADDRASAGIPVEEVLQARCVECHRGSRAKGGLRLTNWDEIARGTKRGGVVSPGRPGESLLWEVIDTDRMPPDDPLTDDERRVVRTWIEAGAPGLPAQRNTHWAFQPVALPQIPDGQAAVASANAIDRFLGDKLARKQLSFRPEADKAALIRRLSFDLLGLPPAPEQVADFLANDSPTAFEELVDQFLASPHYGERWGKYWLDVSGYADSNGYFSADTNRPYAYRYRDYVIAAFNRDMPYDEFVREQIAGDELAGFVPDGDVTRAMAEPLVATHFLRNAQDGTGESDGNPDEVMTDRFSVLEGTVQITVNALLGLTIQCAKCHAHKFEPISQEEYYRLQAVLLPAYLPSKWIKPAERIVTVASRAERAAHRREVERVDRQIAPFKASLEQLTASLREQLLEERLEPLEVMLRAEVLAAYRLPPKKRSPEQRELLEKHVEPLKLTDDDLVRRFSEYAAVRDSIKRSIEAQEVLRPRPLETLAPLTDVEPDPPAHHVFLRGQHNAPGPEVAPGALAVASTAENSFRLERSSAGQTSSGRRRALAAWITSPHNPLFARVMVNRIWQHHFGIGLVSTADNLGQSGAAPTHPELLDFLVVQFIESGWSVKALHRLLVSSAAYRQSSAFDAAAAEIDPSNRLVWRYLPQRLDAEAVRDAMLAVSGDLDCRARGPYVPTQRAADGTVVVAATEGGRLRRSVYLQQRRTQVLTMLELFDAPSIVTTCSVRNVSSVPLQSLALMNSDFARERAAALAARIAPAVDDAEFIAQVYRSACGREPLLREKRASREFLQTQQAAYGDAADARARSRADFCQMVLASNAFLYIE